MEGFDFGYIGLALNDRIKASGLSKNQVAKRSMLERSQLNRYCSGQIQRVDLDVLTRICYTLDCSVEDILVYHPPKQD